MPVIHWRPEVNALTTPQSYKARFMPNNILGIADIAKRMEEYNPALTHNLSVTAISAFLQSIQQALIDGDQVSLEDALIINLSLTGRLDDPDSPLPPVEESLHVRIRATSSFVREIHHQARLERLDIKEKLPQINQVENSTLQLNDVLSSADVLQLHGDHLNFDPQAAGNGECVISGTQSSTAVQTQFGPITDTNIILIPTVPTQDNPWNNEYTLSLSVRYTEHGTMRTAAYRRKLRSPLTVPNLEEMPQQIGILTGNATSPSVVITGGTLTVDTRLRIQVLQDLTEQRLRFSLLDIREGSATGEEVIVTQNGAYALPGFSGSALSSLEITVNDYAALWDLIRNDYSGRLVDVLEVTV